MTGNGVHSGSESQPLALCLLINSLFNTSSSPLQSPRLFFCLPLHSLSVSLPFPLPLSLSRTRVLKDGGIPTFLRCYSNTAARRGKRGRRQAGRRRGSRSRGEGWRHGGGGVERGREGEGGGVWKWSKMRGCVNNANANGGSSSSGAAKCW